MEGLEKELNRDNAPAVQGISDTPRQDFDEENATYEEEPPGRVKYSVCLV